jgi:hypothetical protein
MGALLAPAARADEWNRKTVITFSGPVEIPRIHSTEIGVLPAGTYVFKVLDSSSNRHIVQIFSKDERTVRATILAIPNYRLKTTNETVITFRERASGQPEALRAWFYPGENWGDEFVYQKERAVELAKVAHKPVLFTPPEAPVIEVLKRAPVMAIQPTGEEQLVSPAPPPPPPSSPPVKVAVVAPPAGLGLAPALGLFGFLGLSGVIAMTMIKKHLALMESRINWAQYCRKFF